MVGSFSAKKTNGSARLEGVVRLGPAQLLQLQQQLWSPLITELGQQR